MKFRIAVSVVVVAASLTGPSAFAGGSRCDTWHRRYASGGTYRYSDHTTPGDQDREVVTKDQTDGLLWATLKLPPDSRQDNRYGVNTNEGWVEALGGGGYGSNDYPWPGGRTGEGGVVQGDLAPAGLADVNFSVWATSLDDEGDAGHWHDTYAGTCVSVAGTTVDQLGKAPSPASPYEGSSGNCTDLVPGVVAKCDQGVVLKTSSLPHP